MVKFGPEVQFLFSFYSMWMVNSLSRNRCKVGNVLGIGNKRKLHFVISLAKEAKTREPPLSQGTEEVILSEAHMVPAEALSNSH